MLGPTTASRAKAVRQWTEGQSTLAVVETWRKRDGLVRSGEVLRAAVARDLPSELAERFARGPIADARRIQNWAARWTADRPPEVAPTLLERISAPQLKEFAEMVAAFDEHGPNGVRWVDERWAPAVTGLLGTMPEPWLTARAALGELKHHLRAPSPALAAWLPEHLLLLELGPMSPVRLDFFLALAEAVSAAGGAATWVLASGEDDGGAGAGSLLGFESTTTEPTVALDRSTRTALFDRWISTGRATAHITTAMGTVEIEPGFPPSLPGPPSPAAALAGRPSAGCRLVHALSALDEAHFLALEVSDALRNGATADECLVALGIPNPHLLPALAELGVPALPGGGEPLLDDPALDSMVAYFGLLSGALPPTADQLARLHPSEQAQRLVRLTIPAGLGARPSEWPARIRRWAHARAKQTPTADLDAALAELSEPVANDSWLEASLLGVPEGRPKTVARTELEALARDFAGVDLPAQLLADMALSRLRSTRITRPTDGHVAVVGLRETRALVPHQLWLGGLTTEAGGRPSELIGGPKRRISGGAEVLYLVAEALRSGARLVSWHGEPHPTLRPLIEAHPPEQATAWLPAGPAAETRSAARAHAPRSPAEMRTQAAIEQRDAGALAAFTGQTNRRMVRPGPMPVTRLEAYLRCPFRYGFEREVGLAIDDPYDPELDARRRGIALHQILERFYVERGLRTPTAAESVPAASALASIATEAFAELVAEGGIDPLYLEYLRDHWLAGLTDGAPKGILATWLASEIEGGARVVAVERRFEHKLPGGLEVIGTIDRIDEAGSLGIIIDYKTGSPPSRKALEAGLALQPLIYPEAHTKRSVATYLSMPSAEKLRRTLWVGDAEALDALVPADERRRAVRVTDAERVDQLRDAEEAAARLDDGQFPTTPHGPTLAGCEHCDLQRICRVRHA